MPYSKTCVPELPSLDFVRFLSDVVFLFCIVWGEHLLGAWVNELGVRAQNIGFVPQYHSVNSSVEIAVKLFKNLNLSKNSHFMVQIATSFTFVINCLQFF